MNRRYVYLIFVILALLIFPNCIKKNIKRDIFDKMEKNHYIKNRIFYFSSTFFSFNAQVFSYQKAEFSIKTIIGEDISISVNGDTAVMYPQYRIEGVNGYLKYLPSLIISDINMLKVLKYVYTDNSFTLYGENFTIILKEPKQYGENLLFSKIVISPKNYFITFNAILDSIR